MIIPQSHRSALTVPGFAWVEWMSLTGGGAAPASSDQFSFGFWRSRHRRRGF